MIPAFSMNQLRQAVISFPLFGEKFAICPPASFTLFGREIYFYGVIIALGFLLAILYSVKVSCPRFGITSDHLYDALIVAVPLGVICARLYFCLTYKDANGVNPYLQDPIQMLYVWNGGLAIYGGVIGGALGMVIVSAVKKFSLGALLDVGSPGLLIGQAVGRWGNFMNREAFGWTEKVDTLFCRMGLTVPGYDTFYVHPTFLYESLWNAVGFVGLHVWSKRHRRRFDGQVFVLYLGWYGLGRMMIEGLRTDSLWLIPGKIRISQLLAAVMFVAAIVILAVFCRKKERILWVERTVLSAEAAETAENASAEAAAEEKPETAAAEDENLPEREREQ